jgi:signal peptidase I
MRAIGRFALWAVIGTIAVIALFRLTAIRWWKVPENDPYLVASVGPALRGGDWVLLWRLSPPALGSLALCPEPKHADRVVVGRMIGDEGQHVTVSGTYVEIDGKRLPSEGGCSSPRFTVKAPRNGNEIELRCSTEVVNGSVHERGEAEAIADLPSFEAKVAPGEVLLISDNRRFPYDSRDFGAVDRATCKETVFFRLMGREGFFHSATRFTYIR